MSESSSSSPRIRSNPKSLTSVSNPHALAHAERRKDDLVATAFEKTSKEIVQTKKKGKFEDLRELFGVDPSQKVAD